MVSSPDRVGVLPAPESGAGHSTCVYGSNPRRQDIQSQPGSPQKAGRAVCPRNSIPSQHNQDGQRDVPWVSDSIGAVGGFLQPDPGQSDLLTYPRQGARRIYAHLAPCCGPIGLGCCEASTRGCPWRIHNHAAMSLDRERPQRMMHQMLDSLSARFVDPCCVGLG